RTGRPFTGDESGALLFRSLHALRLCDAPTSSGGDDTPRLRGCRITNAVKCLPPGNRPLADEIMRCNRYLSAEIAALPDDAVLLALGRVAHDAVLRALHVDAATRREMMFAHGAVHAISGLSGGSLWLVDSFHPSRYNVNTGRLSEQMFLRTLTEAARLCALV
ncbi:MAG: uracil-DNA glycosylase, partial [Gammaproteobacteria bacterium]|nr:uracil-DNA glycosylase [Gammaproteobacteria bacterium]